MYIDYERRAQPSKTPPGLQASAFTESNAESLSSVINDHCYIIVKETDTCKHVNITKNKKHYTRTTQETISLLVEMIFTRLVRYKKF